MKRQSKQIEYLGMSGFGKTLKDAKADAQERIKQAMSGSYTPVIIPFRNMMGLIWRDPHGYCSHVFEIGNARKELSGYTIHSSKTLEEVEFQVRFTLAQQCWDGEEETSPVIQERSDSFTYWVKFQKEYRNAREWHINMSRILKSSE